MAGETGREKEGFVSRWSRLKRQQAPSSEETALRPGTDGPPPAGPPQESAESPPVEALPDPDSMEPTADFSVFLRENVPEMLRRRALRRLWRSNPIIGAVDMLDDYCEDFTDAATVIPALRTVYERGRGMLEPAEGQDAEHGAAQKAEDGDEQRAENEIGPPPEDRIEPAEGPGEQAEETSREGGSEDV